MSKFSIRSPINENALVKRFEKLPDIEKYTQLVRLRDLLKDVQQLSWNINNIEKRFPLEGVATKDYKDLLNVYIKLGGEIAGIAHLFSEEIY